LGRIPIGWELGTDTHPVHVAAMDIGECPILAEGGGVWKTIRKCSKFGTKWRGLRSFKESYETNKATPSL